MDITNSMAFQPTGLHKFKRSSQPIDSAVKPPKEKERDTIKIDLQHRSATSVAVSRRAPRSVFVIQADDGNCKA